MMNKNKESFSPADHQKKKTRNRILLEIGIAVVLIGIALLIGLFVNWKGLIINRIYDEIRLVPNSKGYESWLNPPTTITRGYYLFNISNPNEIISNPSSATIRLKETRPYSYVLSATKKDIQWSNDNKAISYSIYRIFNRHPTRFEPSSVNDTGVFVDMLRAIFRTQFQAKPAPAFFAVGGPNTFFHRNAVDQLEGFTSNLFYTMQEKMTGPNIAKSGFIYRYNGSRSYNYTIRTGLMEKGQVLAFASENVPFSFSSPIPYPFTLYDGLTFVPMLFDKPQMNIFQADFCRPISAQFNRAIRMFGGIDVHEYVIKFLDFDNCQNNSDIRTCPEVDMLDISHCISASLKKNTVFLSKVHFYGSKNETMQSMNIEGFTPQRDKHEALIYFEPYSGTPLRAHHRIQLNIEAMIDPMTVSDDGSDPEPTGRRASKRLLPLVWIDQEVNVDDATIGKLRLVHLVLRNGIWIFLGLAVLLSLIIIIIMELVALQARKNARTNRNGNAKSERLSPENNN